MSVTSWSRGLLGALLVGGIATMLSGCVGLFGTDTGPVPWDSPPPGDALPDPNPVSVTPVLDSARAKTVTLGKDGGTASVTGADGTVFTLTVPQGALLEDADITLTPLTDIPGLPTEGGFVAGVDLQPDGLQFAIPADLVMELGSGLDASDLTPGLVSGPDHEFGAVPALVAGRTVSFSLAHFTDPTAGKGAVTGGPVPSSVEGRAESAIAKTVAQHIKLTSAYAQILEQWYDQGVKPHIDRATSDQALLDAYFDYSDWLGRIETLGSRNHVSGLAASLHGRIADGANRYRGRVGTIIQNAVKSCRGGAGPQAGWDVTYLPPVVEVLSFFAESPFYGIISKPDVKPWTDAISNCLHFSLHFVDDIGGSATSTHTQFNATAVGMAWLQAVYAGGDWSLVWKNGFDDIGDFSFSTDTCQVTSWSNLSDTFQIVSVDALRSNPRTPYMGSVDLDPNMRLTFDSGDPAVMATLQCTKGGAGSSRLDLWRDGFMAIRVHQGEPPSQATLTKWAMPWGVALARAPLKHSLTTPNGEWTYTETGEALIFHDPL